MQTSISTEMYATLATAEAVLVREYTRTDGEQFAKVLASGTLENMELEASTNRLVILLPGMASISDYAVLVSDLEMPKGEVAGPCSRCGLRPVGVQGMVCFECYQKEHAGG